MQCIERACYKENRIITERNVEDGLKDALEIGRPWLSNEIKTASDNDIRSFFKIAKLNRRDFASSELASNGVDTVYIGRLVSLKILKKISRGRYKLIKAPIVAYYHMLFRGIKE